MKPNSNLHRRHRRHPIQTSRNPVRAVPVRKVRIARRRPSIAVRYENRLNPRANVRLAAAGPRQEHRKRARICRKSAIAALGPNVKARRLVECVAKLRKEPRQAEPAPNNQEPCSAARVLAQGRSRKVPTDVAKGKGRTRIKIRIRIRRSSSSDAEVRSKQ